MATVLGQGQQIPKSRQWFAEHSSAMRMSSSYNSLFWPLKQVSDLKGPITIEHLKKPHGIGYSHFLPSLWMHKCETLHFTPFRRVLTVSWGFSWNSVHDLRADKVLLTLQDERTSGPYETNYYIIRDIKLAARWAEFNSCRLKAADSVWASDLWWWDFSWLVIVMVEWDGTEMVSQLPSSVS